MHERLLLIEHSIGLLLLFTAVGSGPATGLIRDRRVRFAAMPILGFALTASLLTTAAPSLALATATWVLLVPAAVVSLAAAVALARRRPGTGGIRELAIPIVAFLVGVTLALLPPLYHGTQGPFALLVPDAWGYVPTSLFLQHHSTGDKLPAEVARTDITMWRGALNTGGDARIGVDSVNAAAATLFRSDVGATLTALLAVLFGLTPVVVWLIVRGLGGSWPAAALGSLFGLTPAILSLVEDTALGNLAGGVLAAPALFFIVRSARGSTAEAVVAGSLLGGLAAVYPEFLIPLFVTVACVGLVFGIDRIRRGGSPREWLRPLVTKAGIAAVTAVVIAPNAMFRAERLLSSHTRDGAWTLALPLRYLNVENVGSWLFGVNHLYEMSAVSALPALHLAFSIYFPVLLALVVLIGIARLRLMGVLVAAPIFVAGALGLFGYRDFQNGHCEYCLWKVLTFMIPFLAVGLAFGIERLWQGSGTRRVVFLQRALAVSIAIVALVAIGNSDKRLIRTTRSTAAFCPCELRDLGKRLNSLPSGSPILIEGVGAMPKPFFMVPAVYYATRGHKLPVLLDAGSPAWGVDYLGLDTNTALPYYSPDYTYVLTPYEDVRSNRTLLGRYGPLLLERRAPIDVVVSPYGLTVDDTKPRIPWVSTTMKLRVSSKKAEDAAITISLARLAVNASTLTFASAGQQLASVSKGESEVCVNVRLNKGNTDIDVTPVFDPFVTQLPKGPGDLPQKELGLSAIKAEPGRCGAGTSVQRISFSDGWFPVKQRADGTIFQWMGPMGTVEVGTAGMPRPRVRVDMQAMSLARNRRVDVWLSGKRLASFKVAQTLTKKISFVVPAGRDAARLLFVATPTAESASVLTPTDTRLVSIKVSRISTRTEAQTP